MIRSTLLLARKDLRVLAQNRTAVFFALLFPLVYAFFFGWVFDSVGRAQFEKAIEIFVVDEDQTDKSREFVAKLHASDALKSEVAPNRAFAADQIRRGERAALVVIPAGFAAARARPLGAEPPVLEIGTSPRRQAQQRLLQGVLTRMMFDELRGAFSSLLRLTGQGRGDGAGFEPVHIVINDLTERNTGPRNAFSVSFPQGIMWGLISAAAGFSISIVSERTAGTLARLQLVPVDRAYIVAGKALACFITLTIVSLFMIAVALAVGVRPDSLPLLVLAAVATAIAFTGIMMLLAVLATTEQTAGGLGWAVFTVMAMIGGALVPVFFMPEWLQPLSLISPVKWAMHAYEGAIWRHFSLWEMLLPVAILCAIGFGSFVIGARFLSAPFLSARAT